MEENKKSSSSESENANLQSKYKEIWVLISSINDNTSIHTSIRKFCFKKEDECNFDSDDSCIDSNIDNIVDINASTKGKDEGQIKLLAINSLLSKIEEQKITEIKEEIKYESTEINRERCFGSEEDPFYLQNRNFNERLTFNQIKFLKY